jgi:hypothetical protein
VPSDAAELRAENARLRESAERLRMLVEDKDAKIAELEERIARLERLISRNSGNSSMSPSTDDLPGKKPPERRTRQGGMKRKPGKQPGAPGAFLAWNEHPDKTEDVFPEGICPCGADLADARDLGVKYSHQVTDLPEARAVTIQHDRHEMQCACGRAHIADAPPGAAGAPGTVTYGLNFQAWCVFLLVMHHVPVERCADILESMSGTRPSDGWVHALLERAARAVAAANTAIRALIILARVVCGDETPLRAGPGPKSRKKYLQVACTTLLTYYFPGARDLPSFKNFVYSDALYCRWLPAVVTRYQPSASMSLMISRTFRGNDHSILDGRRSSWDDPRSGAPCTSTLRDPCDSGSSPAGSLRRRNSGISRHYSTSGDQDAPGQRQDDRDGEELIEGGHVELRGGPGPRPPRRC